MKKILLLTWLLAGGAMLSLYAQNNAAIGKVTISSPTAASLGKYGDIPVSNHTGIPNINIPLYTVKAGTLELPVSLSYHASGMKVQEQASWVGAGWALNAGGVITRTVVGAPDDKGFNAAVTQKGHYTDYGYNSYLFSPGPINCLYVGGTCPAGRPGVAASNYPAQDTYIESGILDGEPDLYFFNFANYSGKFYFNDDRSVVMVPEQDLKVTPIYTGSDWRGMTGFIITTPDGTQYYFGQNPATDGNPDAIEITYDISTQSSYTGQGAVSAWCLNKIMSADGEFTISLIYTPESYSYYGLSMYPVPGVSNPNFFSYNYEYDLNKNFVNGVRLSRIVFPNGEVDFTAGALRQDMSLGTGPFPHYTYTGISDLANNDATLGTRSLGAISVQSGTVCKKYSFYYGYFFDNSPITGTLFTASYPTLLNTTSDEYRLRLDSVQESSCDASVSMPPYKFSYYPGTVPRKLSFGIDHWGFYNGVNSNTGLIPTYVMLPQSSNGQVTTVTGADRDSHWPNSQNGVLQQIVYPTGGSSSFVYEANDVYAARTTYSMHAILSGVSAGYSGPSTLTQTGSFTTDASSNIYRLDLSSNQPSNQGGGNINFSTGQGYSVGNGGSITVYLNFPPNTTVNYTLTDNNSGGQISGYGVSASLAEQVPTTTNANIAIGGVRIKQITNNDAMTANDVVTTYRYAFNNVAGGQSSGVLYSRPVYIQGIRNDAWAHVNGANCSAAGCLTCFGSNVSYYRSPSSIRPMASTQGNHIGYSEVYIAQAGNGYVQEKYYGNNGAFAHPYDPPVQDVAVRTLNLACDPSIPNSPAPPDPFDPMRGELAFRGQYRDDGVLLKGESTLPVYQFDPVTTPGLIVRFFVTGYTTPPTDPLDMDPMNMVPVLNLVPVGITSFTEYNLQSAKKIKDSITTISYDPASGGYLTDIRSIRYTSSYHHQPTQQLTYSSKGETLVTNTKYAADFRIANFNVTDQLPAYNSNISGDNHYVDSALGAVTLPASDPNYISQRLNIYTNYRYLKAMDRQTYINWSRQNFTDPGNVYATSHTTAKSAADAELKPVLELQDEYNNPAIETSTFRNGSLMHAEFIHYDYAVNPANFVYPGKTRLVNLQATASAFSDAVVSGNTVTRDSRYADEVFFNFKAGNVQQAIAHDGVVNAYIWDYLNSAPIAKLTGAAVDSMAYTSFEADGSGNWTIGSTTRDASSSITGSVSYNLVNGSISKTGLASGNTYVVSYWSRTGNSFSVTGSMLVRQGKTISINGGSWTYFEHTVTGAGTVTVSGSGDIDELRLYPASAQMTTYTYAPSIGITSECDVNNRVTYYNYDALGRLSLVKDQDGNVLKTIEYHYKGQ